MKKIVIAAAMSLCVVSLAALASADALILRDGTRVRGSVVSIAERTITFEDSNGVSRRYNMDQARLDRGRLATSINARYASVTGSAHRSLA